MMAEASSVDSADAMASNAEDLDALATADQAQVPPSEDASRVSARGLRRQLFALWLLVLGTSMLFAGGHSYAIDNEVQFQTTRSLVHLRPYLTDLDEGWAGRDDGPYRTRSDGEQVGIVALGQSVLSVPAYLSSRVIAQGVPINKRDQFVRTGTFFTNSWLLATTAVLVALLALELAATPLQASVLGAIYGVGTYALPNAGTYFTETGSGMYLALACLLAARAWKRAEVRPAVLSGIAIGAGFFVRPSLGLFLPVIGSVLAITVWRLHGLRKACSLGLCWGLGAIAMLGVNGLGAWWRFGSPFDLGYQKVFQNFPLVDGLWGQAFSPGKGLIFYAPIVVPAILGMSFSLKRNPPLSILLVCVAGLNSVFFARVPFWAGDAAWGPRYTLMILPVLVPLATPLLAVKWGRIAVGVTGILGFLLPALMGSMLSFTVGYIDTGRAVGFGNETAAMHSQWKYQPILRSAQLIPDALGDVVDPSQEDLLDRGPFTGNPDYDWGYYGAEPRVDVWWLWIGPTRADRLTLLFGIPTVAALCGAVVLMLRPRGVPSLLKPKPVPPG